MSVPVPNLDDRAFQDLVDEAKRYVSATCPALTLLVSDGANA